jgi:putative ABC transport system permease protein
MAADRAQAGAAPGAGAAPAWALLAAITRREWWHHRWRHAAALLAVALGVALAWSVHLVNRSALAEFSAAVRAANGTPDAVLRGPREGFADTLLDALAADAAVELASPIVEADTEARSAAGARVALRVIGLDALVAGAMAPEVQPRPAEGAPRTAAIDPGLVFLNPAAERLLLDESRRVALRAQGRWQSFPVGGRIAAGGAPLVVMDVSAAQQHFGLPGRLTRIDLRLVPGADAAALRQRVGLPPGVRPTTAEADEQRVSNLSRAYRVNLTVLALVALLVGGFLVYSVVALAVAQRTPQFALLGVLGLPAAARRQWVLGECAALGAIGSAIGLVAGTGLAAAALRFLAGDLGGGYFPGVQPPLAFSWPAALAFGALGVLATVAGGLAPARAAERIAPAQALKGLGSLAATRPRAAPVVLLLAAGAALAFAPPVAGLPLAAYASVALLLAGGVAAVPLVVQALLPGEAAAAAGAGGLAGPLLARLALARARFARATATAAVAGVVASLALSVALTVMVGSFRAGVTAWLDDVLPADLYARAAGAGSEQAFLAPAFVAGAAAIPGVARVSVSRSRPVSLAPERPTVALIERELDDPARALPLVGEALPLTAVGAGELPAFVSEAMVALYGAAPGQLLEIPLAGRSVRLRVLGVWRDFARQFGAIVVPAAAVRAITGDARLTDLALVLAPGAAPAPVQAALRDLAERTMGEAAAVEFASARELRVLSLRIFDRSFAVTSYLQAVAIGVGLVGVAASLSAQVLSRRKEFGLLAHLGFTRRQVAGLVAIETGTWVAAGVAVGLALGIAVAAVLVHVVNPQSFHWTMALVLPPAPLAALCLAVGVAGTGTALLAARQAAARPAVLAVKEDW